MSRKSVQSCDFVQEGKETFHVLVEPKMMMMMSDDE